VAVRGPRHRAGGAPAERRPRAGGRLARRLPLPGQPGLLLKRSSAAWLRRLLPDLNRASDTICDDQVADERFGYYLVVNNLLGVVGALGAAGLAGERALLADLAAHLRASAPRPPLLRTLLEGSHLRCKANLRTRLAGLDELAGPLETQSVYVDLPNPLAGAGRAA